jgi:hypothetical protein
MSSRTIKIMHTPGAIGKWDKIVELAKEFQKMIPVTLQLSRITLVIT